MPQQRRAIMLVGLGALLGLYPVRWAVVGLAFLAGMASHRVLEILCR